MIKIEKPEVYLTKCSLCHSNSVASIRFIDEDGRGNMTTMCRDCLNELKLKIKTCKL